MLLYEFEGKKLFKNCGINVPVSQLVSMSDRLDEMGVKAPLVLKVQTLSGKRAQSGGIVRVDRQQAVGDSIKKLFNTTVNGEKVSRILVEEMITYDEEYYLSFSYSTETRTPIMTFGKGGTGVEKKGAKSYPINILTMLHLGGEEIRLHLGGGIFGGGILPEELLETALKLWQVFTKYDCELVEINPLVVVSSPVIASDPPTGGERGNLDFLERKIPTSPSVPLNDKVIYALDAKVILDDDADFRREIKYEGRSLFGRAPTEAEIEARKIDKGDHRGTAGSVYWDLDGDIAVIAAGGGGSVVNMDSLIAFGGKPANYTEHSGNPPREKLKKLTKLVLSKKGLKGCWIVGGTANFTDIYETLMGFVEGLREVNPKPTYPIVIRRGGPRDEEAFTMLREVGKKEGFDFHIYGRETPMSATAKIMVKLAYRQ